MRNAVKWTMIAAVLIITPAVLAQNSTAPSIKNGGFENGKNGWWGPGAKDTASQIIKQDAPEGDACLKLSSGWLCQDKIKIEGGKRYRISMQVRTDSTPDNSVYVQLSYRGGSLQPQWYGPVSVDLGDHSEPALFATGRSHPWRKFTAVVQAPAAAAQLLIYLRRSSGTGSGYFDDIQIQPTDDAPTGGTASTGGEVRNGGFEKGAASWWGSGTSGPGNEIANDNPAEGDKYLKLTTGWVCQDKIAITDNTNYRISMKVKCSDVPEDGAFVQISFRGDNVDAGWRGPARVKVAGHDEAAALKASGTHDWKDMSTVIETPKGANQILIYLRKQGETGAVYYDDVKIQPTDDKPISAADIKRNQMAAQWLAPATDPAGAADLVAKIANSAANNLDSITLADQGRTTYRIYVGDKIDIVSLNAAIELAENLQKITGASFGPFAHDSAPFDQPLLIVGRDNVLTQKLCPDIPYDTLGHDGFVIRTVGANIVIAGATPRSTLYGVYWLLDRHLGVKWFDPDFTVIPSKPTLVLKPIHELQKPRFTYREVFSREAHDNRYAAHNLLNGRSHGRSFHPSAPEIDDWADWYEVKGGVADFWQLLDRKNTLKTHPEWFTGGQVAMMNPQVRAKSAETIIAMLKKLKDYHSVVFHINDMDWGWDMDPASKKFADEHGGEPSAPRLDMVIDIANRVRKELPGARFSFNAYHWSFTPPTGMSVPDYIIVNPMDIHVDYAHPLFEGPNKKLGQDITGWCKIADNVLFWDHTINFFGYIQPTPNLYPIGESIPWLARHPQIFGYFCEDSWNTRNAEFANLRTWMIARLLWDPTLDYKTLIKQFVDGYYGDAGPFIHQYIDAMHESIAKTDGTLREKTTPDAPYLTFDFLTKADKLFEQAHEAVKDQPEFLKHVEITRMSVDCTILYRRAEFEADAKRRGIDWNPDTANRMQRLYANWRMSGMSQYRQGGDFKQLQADLAIQRHEPTRPDIVKDLPDSDWVEYSDMTINRYGAQLTADPMASDGGALVLHGNLGGWNAQFRRYKLPKDGLWDVYIAVRIDRGNATDDQVALNIGISPPMGHFKPVTVGELGDGRYHWIKAMGSPMSYEQDDAQLIYFQPRPNVVDNIYIDRIVAIRHQQ